MQNTNSFEKNGKKGFTLIELSIVLVIIGLIIGGILVGQDLISAAEIRATIQQYEKMNSAVNTFRGKYGGIPGDILAQTASNFGLFTFTSPAAGLGNGDGQIDGGSANALVAIGETVAFWRHLSDADLIEGSFMSATVAGTCDYITPATGVIGLAATASTLPTMFPLTKIKGNYITVHHNSGLNYYQISYITAVSLAGAYTHGANLSPRQALAMDEKLDDGKPASGVVIFVDNGTATPAVPASAAMNIAGTTGAALCATSATAYNLGASYVDTPLCSLRLRFN